LHKGDSGFVVFEAKDRHQEKWTEGSHN